MGRKSNFKFSIIVVVIALTNSQLLYILLPLTHIVCLLFHFEMSQNIVYFEKTMNNIFINVFNLAFIYYWCSFACYYASLVVKFDAPYFARKDKASTISYIIYFVSGLPLLRIVFKINIVQFAVVYVSTLMGVLLEINKNNLNIVRMSMVLQEFIN